VDAAIQAIPACRVERGCLAQRTEPLYPHGVTGAVGQEEADKPSLAYYPAAGGGTAVVVFPGGGYRNLAMDHEGKQTAEWLNGLGISAFVLKYRLGPRDHHPAMMNDAQRAIRTVRLQAAELGVAPDRIGVWGFSAGGRLASTVSTHFDKGNPSAADPVERVSCRPDFAILAYPVISLTTAYTHQGSKRNLLGENPDPKLVEGLSNELQMTSETPPTFLFHTNADTGVPAENSVLYYLAPRKAGVPAEMHIYQNGKHGVGLARQDAVPAAWSERLADWLRTRGLIGR